MAKKILLASILAIFLFVVTVQAQINDLPNPGLLPDSPFYFLKIFFERAGTFFTFRETVRAERFLNLAEIRLAEGRALAEKGRTDLAQRAVERYQEQLAQALAKAEQAGEKGFDIDEVLARVSEATLRHQAVLIDVYQKVPQQAQPAIEQAIERSRHGHEEAWQAISGEKRQEIRERIEKKKREVEQKAEEARERGIPIPKIPAETPTEPEEIIPDTPKEEIEPSVIVPMEEAEMPTEAEERIPEMPEVEKPGLQ